MTAAPVASPPTGPAASPLQHDVDRAVALISAGDWPGAIEAWQHCFEAHAGARMPWWHSSLGLALRKAGRTPEAAELYREARQKWPEDAAGRIGLAEIAAAEGNWAEAAALWQSCLDTSDAVAHPWWYAALAQALRRCGRGPEARDVCLRAQHRWPGEPAGWTGFAELASGAQDWAAAIPAWTECLARFPAMAQCWWYEALCTALRRTGRWPEARRRFAQARRRWPLEGLHLYLDALFHDRHLKHLSRLLAEGRLRPSPLVSHHRSRLALYEGVTPHDLPDIASLQDPAYPRYIRSQMQETAAETAIRRKDVACLDDLTARDWFSVSPSMQAGIARFYMAMGCAAKAAKYVESRTGSMPAHRRLMFMEVGRELAGAAPGHAPALPLPADWRGCAELYAASIPNARNRQLIGGSLVAPLLRVPAGGQDFMDIRFDAGRRSELLAILFRALDERRPLSLIRLADGESYGFHHPGEDAAVVSRLAEDDHFREAHWWAGHPDAAGRNSIREAFEQAVLSADILGIPSVYKLARAFDTDAENLFLGMPFRSFYKISKSLERLRLLEHGARLFTEERCHHLLLSSDLLDRLVARAPQVVVVSCWTPEQLRFKRRDGVSHILIPPHTKVARESRYHGGDALFESYGRVLDQIDNACRGFALVIVAAGILGKIFVSRARERGCVALDAGAMLDYYIGRATRNSCEIV